MSTFSNGLLQMRALSLSHWGESNSRGNTNQLLICMQLPIFLSHVWPVVIEFNLVPFIGEYSILIAALP